VNKFRNGTWFFSRASVHLVASFYQCSIFIYSSIIVALSS